MTLISSVLSTKNCTLSPQMHIQDENIELNCKLGSVQFLLLKYKINIFFAQSDFSELPFDRLLQNRTKKKMMKKKKKRKKKEGESIHHALNVSCRFKGMPSSPKLSSLSCLPSLEGIGPRYKNIRADYICRQYKVLRCRKNLSNI